MSAELSGHAGGRTVQNHDELRERHLFWSQNSPSTQQQDVIHCRVDGIVSGDAQALLQPGMDWIYEQGQTCWDEWTIIAVCASPAAGIESESAIIDITTLAQNIQTTPTSFSLDIPLTELPYGEDTVITLFNSYSRSSSIALMPAAMRTKRDACRSSAMAEEKNKRHTTRKNAVLS